MVKMNEVIFGLVTFWYDKPFWNLGTSGCLEHLHDE